jgi:mitochondrial fission protein ELM1
MAKTKKITGWWIKEFNTKFRLYLLHPVDVKIKAFIKEVEDQAYERACKEVFHVLFEKYLDQDDAARAASEIRVALEKSQEEEI